MNAWRALLVTVLTCTPLAGAPGMAHAAAAGVVPAPAPEDVTHPEVLQSAYSVQVPPGDLLLGERLELRVRGPLKPGSYLPVPSPPEGVEVGASRIEDGVGEPVLYLPLRVTREGVTRLEGLEIVTGEMREALPPVELNVVLDLPAGHSPRVAEALPPVKLPGVPAWAIGGGIVLGLLLLLAGYLLWKRRRKPDLAVVAPPRAPDAVADEAFASLRARLPRTADDVPPFVTELSDVLRTYIEDRFGVRAPESTTEEFLSVVAQRHDALATRRESLAGFLTQCDLVKFARHRPEPTFALPLLDLAERFVADTRPAPVPVPGAGTGDGAPGKAAA